MLEQKETLKYWQCPNNEAHPLKFGAKIYGTSTYRMYCLNCPDTVAVFRSKPIPAPVVSTAAPEPPDEICPNCQGVHAPKVVMSFVKPVAPESYKPAEGPSVGQFWTEWAKRQGLSPEESWLVSRNHARQFAEAYAAHVAAAASPVTVEALGNGQKSLKEAVIELQNHLEDVLVDASFEKIDPKIWNAVTQAYLATPKPIGDVEALLDELATSPDKTYCQRGRDELRAILSPLLAPAGPAGLCPKCKSDTFYIECNRCDYDFMGNVFDVFKSFEAQPPCSECATPSDKWYMEYQAAVARAVQAETERDDYRHKWNDVLIHEDAALKSCRSLTAQLSTLRDALEAIRIALKEPAGGEYWTARKFLDERGIYHGDLDDLRVLNKVAEAALAPTPEVAKE